MKKSFTIENRKIVIRISVNKRTNKPFIQIDSQINQYFIFSNVESDAITHFYKIGYKELNSLLKGEEDLLFKHNLFQIKVCSN